MAIITAPNPGNIGMNRIRTDGNGFPSTLIVPPASTIGGGLGLPQPMEPSTTNDMITVTTSRQLTAAESLQGVNVFSVVGPEVEHEHREIGRVFERQEPNRTVEKHHGAASRMAAAERSQPVIRSGTPGIRD